MSDLEKKTDVYKRATIVLCLCGALAVYYLLNNKPSQQQSSEVIRGSLDDDLGVSYSGDFQNYTQIAKQSVPSSDNLYGHLNEELQSSDVALDFKVEDDHSVAIESNFDQVMEDIAIEDMNLVDNILADAVVDAAQDLVTESQEVSHSSEESYVLEDVSTFVESLNFVDCDLKAFGVKLSCEENWKVVQAQPEEQKIMLSESPDVVVSWKRWDKKLNFLGQVNMLMLENMNLYKKGFRIERVQFLGYESVLVKGFSQRTEAQFRDYYYLYEGHLIQTSFQVNPGNQWDAGKFLIEDIKEKLVGLN